MAPSVGRALSVRHVEADMPRRDTAFCFVIFRDNEDAYVSVNGKTCWSKTNLIGTSGTQECGGGFKEESFRVTGCYGILKREMPLTVRVWTSLDADASDESFAIDIVVVRPLQEVVVQGYWLSEGRLS